MFERKIEKYISDYLTGNDERILCVDGARQIGKSFIIRYLAKKYYPNYIEINMIEDTIGERMFQDIKNKDDFYLQLSILYGDKVNYPG